MLMRHAKSAWNTPATADFDRPLKARGHAAALAIGRELYADGSIPDIIITSTAKRAVQTAEHVAQALSLTLDRITQDGRIYDASMETLLEVIAARGENAQCLLIIGHNLSLKHLTIYLSKKPLQPAANGKLMPTAALATLRHDGAWTELNVACCSTTKIMRPSELKPALHT